VSARGAQPVAEGTVLFALTFTVDGERISG